MKKITSFLMVMLAFLCLGTTAWAQVAYPGVKEKDASTKIISSRFYVIQSVGSTDRYWLDNNYTSDANLHRTIAGSSFNLNSPTFDDQAGYVWKLVEVQGGYTIQSQLGRYVGGIVDGNGLVLVEAQENAGVFELTPLEEGSAQFSIKISGGKYVKRNDWMISSDENAPSESTGDLLWKLYEVQPLPINTDRYYRIRNQWGFFTTETAVASNATGSEAGYEKDNRKVTRTEDKTGITTVFSFDGDNENGYKIRVANDNLPLGSAGGDPVFLGIGINEEYAGKFYLAGGKDSENLLMMFGENNSEKNYLSTEYQWYIEEAKSVKFEVDALGYISVNFPFAVKIPAGATAYIATATNDKELTLAEGWTGGMVMPKNTPVFIGYEGGKQTLEFEIQAVSATGDACLSNAENKLQGTTARRSDFVSEANYALTSNGSEAVVRKVALTSFPANKAYLPVSAVSASASSMLKFYMGNATGIESMDNGQWTMDNDAPIYDLNGRRVFYPSKGIYVTGSGKKVFLK